MLLAAAALQEGMAAPVMHLRNVNPHVAAALKDWARHSGHAAATVPRQASGAAPAGLLLSGIVSSVEGRNGLPGE